MVDGTDRITSLLTYFLDVQSRRAQITAANVANADTPGYKAKELDFAEELRRAASEDGVQGEDRMDVGRIRVTEQQGAAGIDGNSVDMGREMSALSDSGMQYLFGTQLLQERLRTLKLAIREGR